VPFLISSCELITLVLRISTNPQVTNKIPPLLIDLTLPVVPFSGCGDFFGTTRLFFFQRPWSPFPPAFLRDVVDWPSFALAYSFFPTFRCGEHHFPSSDPGDTLERSDRPILWN